MRTHHQLRGYSDAFMIEPVITHDVELSVLAVNGGRFQVMAGRSNTMERLLMLEKSGTLIAPSDFSPPSCRPHVLSQRLRGMHTAMVLRQRTRGDAAGRREGERRERQGEGDAPACGGGGGARRRSQALAQAEGARQARGGAGQVSRPECCSLRPRCASLQR